MMYAKSVISRVCIVYPSTTPVDMNASTTLLLNYGARHMSSVRWNQYNNLHSSVTLSKPGESPQRHQRHLMTHSLLGQLNHSDHLPHAHFSGQAIHLLLMDLLVRFSEMFYRVPKCDMFYRVP